MLELSRVAYYGDANLIPSLIARGENIHEVDTAGNTPLHWAAIGGRLDSVEILIANNADVNIQNLKGKTPMHLACFFNRDKMVEAFIKAGADLTLKDNDGRTPLDTAVKWRYNNVITILSKEINLYLDKQEQRKSMKP